MVRELLHDPVNHLGLAWLVAGLGLGFRVRVRVRVRVRFRVRVNHLGLAWQPEQREEEAERLVEDEPGKVEQP